MKIFHTTRHAFDRKWVFLKMSAPYLVWLSWAFSDLIFSFNELNNFDRFLWNLCSFAWLHKIYFVHSFLKYFFFVKYFCYRPSRRYAKKNPPKDREGIWMLFRPTKTSWNRTNCLKYLCFLKLFSGVQILILKRKSAYPEIFLSHIMSFDGIS